MNGEVSFFVTDSNTSGGLFKIDGRHKQTREVKIPSITLDELLLTYCSPDKKVFVKMDIEGGEYRVIKGFCDRYQGDLTLFMEIHDWGDPSIKMYPWHIFQIMESKNYAPKHFKRHYLFQKSTENLNTNLASKFFQQKHKIKNNLRKTFLYQALKKASGFSATVRKVLG